MGVLTAYYPAGVAIVTNYDGTFPAAEIHSSAAAVCLQGDVMERDCVVIWINKVIGGRGQFGVDLILDDGTKLPYYFNPRFGTPEDNAKFDHGLVLTNKDFARRLKSANLEFYPESVDGQGRKLFMGVSAYVDSFGHYANGCWYSSAICIVPLPRVEWTPGAENYGRLVGPVHKNGVSTKDRVDIDFRQREPFNHFSYSPDDPAVRWPLRGYSSTGNLAFHSQVNPSPTPEGWFDSGPVIRADYEVTITHHPPGTNKFRQVIAWLGILQRDANTVFDVAKPGFGLPSENVLSDKVYNQ